LNTRKPPMADLAAGHRKELKSRSWFEKFSVNGSRSGVSKTSCDLPAGGKSFPHFLLLPPFSA
jgi:hypothetical protein